MALLLRTLDLPQVRETCPNAAQHFLLQISESLLPAIDDSDSAVRLEAAKCLAILIHRTGSLPEDVVPVLMRIPKKGPPPVSVEALPNPKEKIFPPSATFEVSDAGSTVAASACEVPLPSPAPLPQVEEPAKAKAAAPAGASGEGGDGAPQEVEKEIGRAHV